MQQMGLEATTSPAALDAETLATELKSPRAKLVYLYLATARGGSVEELTRALGMTRLDLLSILDSLSKAGHVDCDGERYSLA